MLEIFLLIYLTIAFLISHYVLEEYHRNSTDDKKLVMWIMVVLYCLVWPLAIIIWLVKKEK